MRFASVTDRLRGLGSDKWALHFEARRLAAADRPVLELTIGEPDMAPPRAVVEAAIAALERGRIRYSSGRGEASVLEALARRYSARTGRPVGTDQIAYMPGTQTALYAAMRTLVEAGDEVLVGDPLYATYEGVIRATGAEPAYVPLRAENGFHLRADDLEARITPRTRALLLNSPHNPTGATLSAAEIADIVAVCRRHDLWIVSDEVYETLVYGAGFASPFDHAEGAERTVAVASISKSHMLPGLRAGWCVGPVPFIDRLLPLSESMLFGAQPFIADAAAAAIDGTFEECRAMVKTFRARAAVLPERLAGAPGLACAMPEGGMFAMVGVAGTGLTGEAFAWRLLEEEGVAVMPGSAFGAQAAFHVRVSLTVEAQVLAEAARRMRRLAERLAGAKAA